MEYLFFMELISWLSDKGARISSYSIELDDKYYYTESSSDIRELFEMFKKDRL